MDGEGQKETSQPKERIELKEFSDVQLLDELKKRLGSSLKVDPIVVEKLQLSEAPFSHPVGTVEWPRSHARF